MRCDGLGRGLRVGRDRGKNSNVSGVCRCGVTICILIVLRLYFFLRRRLVGGITCKKAVVLVSVIEVPPTRTT
jgi:hypothetical protein